MKRRKTMLMGKKSLIITLSCAAGLVLLLITLALVAPLFIKQEYIRGKIIQEISRSTHADIQVARVALSILPRPCVVARGVTLSITGGPLVSIKRAAVYPALLPLLRADIQPARINIEAPALQILLTQKTVPAPAVMPDVSAAGLQKLAAAAITSFAQNIPPCSVTVTEGAVGINSPDRTLFSFSDIQADLVVSADRIAVSAGCTSNIWKELTLQAAAGISSRHIDGTVSFSHLAAGPIAGFFFPGTLKIGGSAIDGKLTAAVDQASGLHAELKCSIPHLTLNAAGKKQVVRGALNQLLLTADAHTTAIFFSAQFDYPQLSVAGKYTSNNSSRETALEVDGKKIDLAACRDVVMAGVGNPPLLRDINARLKGGTITDICFKAQGPFDSSLMENKNTSLNAGFSRCSILIPEAGLDLQEVSGELDFRGGMLEAKNLQARYENSRVYGGTILLDLSHTYKPALVGTEFTCDLSCLPRFIHLIPAPDTRNELSLIKTPRGTASGRLTVTEEKGSYKTEVTISSLNLEADYRAFPMPLVLRGGTCVYSSGTLSFNRFSGMLGRATIPDISASFSLRDDHLFKITSSGSTISLDELLVALNSFPATQKIFRDVTQATGSIAISSLDINGPLANPEAWKFALRGGVRDVTLAAPLLEGPVKIKSAALQADQQVFSLSEARAAFWDSSLEGSLTLNGYLQGIEKATGSARGALGEKSLERVLQYGNVPAELTPRAPLSVAKSRLTWSRSGATEFSGDFSCGTGPRVSLELRTDPEVLEIKKLKISDRQSESLLRLGIKEDWVDIAYTGTIDRETLDRLLVNNQFVRGWVRGDFTAQMDQKNPLKSTARGTLAWKDVLYPGLENMAVQVQSASVAAAGNSLQVAAIDASVGNSDLHARGSVTFSEAGYVMDMDVVSDSIDLDAAKKALTKDAASPADGAEELWETPLRGSVRFTARSLSRGSLRWEPFNADILFSDKTITITATDAKLCNIATPGTVVVTPDTMTLEVKPAAQKAAIKTVVKCLTGEKSIITGTLDVTSDLTACGAATDLGENFGGKISITARNGRIYRSNLLTKILSFLSIRNLVTGGTTDIAKKGFAYRSINVKGEIKGNTFKINQGFLDSTTLSLAWQGSIDLAAKTMDITVLATPFQLSDLLLMAVPVVGIIFSKTLIGVPLQATGPIDDPKLRPASPLAIGKGLVGILTNIVKLPVKIIEPVLPEKGAQGR